MKIGILTFLHNENYGSSLQAWALQKTLREMGFDCEHIDYRPDRKEKIRNLLESGNSWKLIAEGLRKKSVRAGQQGARQKSAEIQAFYEREMKLSPVCRTQEELREISRRYDTLICGSDQIWNPVWLNGAYFLHFAPAGKKKIAYAASLGVREPPAERKVRLIRQWTEDFAALSVREEEGAKLLKQMTGRDAAVMPDPVCLVSREEWRNLAGKAGPEEPYLLCYFIGENPGYWQTVRRLREETGLPVRVMPVTAESYACEFDRAEGAGPREFVRLMDGAALLCTDSFHGLALATILGKRTELIRRYRDDDPESKNSRVDHFLRSAGTRGIGQMREEGLAWLREQL